MSYTAKHYVRISGRKFTPGEIIDIPIPEDKLERLLRLNAIERSAIFAIGGEAHDETDESVDERGAGQSDTADDADNSDRMDSTSTDESEEAEEAPEIDVMDGIVSRADDQPEAESEKKETAKKSTRGRKKM